MLGRDGERSFEYPPLHDPTNQIRLLKIGPGRGRIVCDLYTFPVAELPTYSAISYTWGNASATKTIIVNGRQVQVRKNCWLALAQTRKLRPDFEWIWIDSISINQSNTHEKSSQVEMMGDIFQRADTVLVSLEDKGGHGRQLASHVRHVTALRKKSLIFTEDPSAWARNGAVKWKESLDSSDRLELVDAIDSVLLHPYWTRLWVFQELKLATQKVLMYGSYEIDWRDFDTLLCVIAAIWGNDYFLLRAPHGGRGKSLAQFVTIEDSPMMKMIYHSRAVRLHTFDSLLHWTSSLDCSDPRDRIFGLTKCVSWGKERRGPTVDYDKPALQLAIEVVDFMQICTPAQWNDGSTIGFFDQLFKTLGLRDKDLTNALRELLQPRNGSGSELTNRAVSSAGRDCVCSLPNRPRIAMQEHLSPESITALTYPEIGRRCEIKYGLDGGFSLRLHSSRNLYEGFHSLDYYHDSLSLLTVKEAVVCSLNLEVNDLVAELTMYRGSFELRRCRVLVVLRNNANIFQIVGYALSVATGRGYHTRPRDSEPLCGLNLFLDPQDIVVLLALSRTIERFELRSRPINNDAEIHKVFRTLNAGFCRLPFSSFAAPGPASAKFQNVPPICTNCGGRLGAGDRAAHLRRYGGD